MNITEIDFTTHSGPELVLFFNTMVKEMTKLGQERREVSKFADLQTGIKRCQALQSDLRAAKSGLKGKDDGLDIPESLKVPVSERGKGQGRREVPAFGSMAKIKEDLKKNGAEVPRKPPAPSVKKEAPPPKSAKVKPEGIAGQFDVREGTNKAKLLDVMSKADGKPILLKDIIKGVYGGVPADEFRGPVLMVMKGLQVAIDKKKLPWKIEKEKNDAGETYALVAK